MKKKYFYIFILLIINCINLKAQDILEKGIASFYADKFEGKITASGETYQKDKLTAAHPELAFGTFIRVTNLENNLSVVVAINDRGPYIGNRIIDLSKKAAMKLDFIDKGTTEVSVEIIENANGDDLNKIEKPNSNEDLSEFYRLTATKLVPSGFGIQIASYAEIANLMKIANSLNNEIKDDLIIQVSKHKDNQVYRLIIGNYKTRYDAEKHKDKLVKEYPDCFIVNLNI